MIRLRPLRPREKRSLRHWAMELAVVVVGVLIALWAAEWAEKRRDAAQLADYEAALKRELQRNYWLAASHEMLVGCYSDFSRQLEQLLLEDAEQWPGSSTRFTRPDLDTTGLTYGITGVNPIYLSTDMWEAAKQSGVLDDMSLERLSDYQDAYGTVEFMNSGVERVEKMRDSLSGLVHPHSISLQTRTEALRDLANFNNGIQRLDQREQFDDNMIALGFQIPPFVVEALETEQREARENGQACYDLQPIASTMIADAP